MKTFEIQKQLKHRFDLSIGDFFYSKISINGKLSYGLFKLVSFYNGEAIVKLYDENKIKEIKQELLLYTKNNPTYPKPNLTKWRKSQVEFDWFVNRDVTKQLNNIN